MHDRAMALAATTCSQGRRAMAWNTYVVPLVPYPAHVSLPTQVQTRDMRQDLSVALRHAQSRWCPLYVLPGLAILYGIPSAPKCPVATALAVGASAWVRQDTWGPTPLAAALQQPWLAAVRWARRPTPTWIPPRQQQTLRKAADLILQAELSHFWEPRTTLPRALLQALYTALWTATHGQQAYSWFTMRSAARKWAPGLSAEWTLLSAAGSFTAAVHVLRLLTGALPGGARWRSRDTRTRCPKLCVQCGAAARHVWTTPSDADAGLSWCSTCFGHWARGDAWALLPRSWLPNALHESADALCATRSSLNADWPCSTYAPCPLCGHGEAGAEHLLCWCPAVALAWQYLHLGERRPIAQILQPPQAPGPLAEFLHQVAHLHGVLLGRATLTAQEAAGRLARACTAASSFADADTDDLDSNGAPVPELATWGPPDPDCREGSSSQIPIAVSASAPPATARAGPRWGWRTGPPTGGPTTLPS